MTMYTEPETHQARQEWLYSRVMTYRLLSEMLERKPTLSKLIEWKKEASKINRLFTNDYALLHTLENTMLNDIMQYARQECAEYSQLFEQDQHVSYPPQASYYLTNEQGRTAYEAVVNAVYARAGIAFKKWIMKQMIISELNWNLWRYWQNVRQRLICIPLAAK